MTRRIRLGLRDNGDNGLFVSPVGVDCVTAADSALILNITSKVSQLILLGSVASNATVALGLSQKPFVFVTSYNSLGYAGHSWGGGPLRPSPCGSSFTSSHVTINSGGASMDLVVGVKTVYAVYSKAF